MSFEEFIAIQKEAKQIAREDASGELTDCPVCGHKLDENPRGQVNCPFGHFTQDGRRREVA